MVLPVIFVSFILWKSLQTGGDVGAAFAVFGLVPYPYTPSEPLHRTMQPFGSDPHSGSFLDHLLMAAL